VSGTSARIRATRRGRMPPPAGYGSLRPDSGLRPAEYGLSDLLRYRFDNVLARGPIALIALLGLASLLTVVLAAAIVAVAGIGGTLPFTGLLYRLYSTSLIPEPRPTTPAMAGPPS
jgi:hypothetical protein